MKFSDVFVKCVTLGEAVPSTKEGDYIEIVTKLYPLKTTLERFRHLVVTEDLIDIGDEHDIVSDPQDLTERIVHPEDSAWGWLEDYLVRRCTAQNVLLKVEKSLARLRLMGKDVAVTQVGAIADEIIESLNDYVDSL
jgi:hypothetical protein